MHDSIENQASVWTSLMAVSAAPESCARPPGRCPLSLIGDNTPARRFLSHHRQIVVARHAIRAFMEAGRDGNEGPSPEIRHERVRPPRGDVHDAGGAGALPRKPRIGVPGS